MATEFFEPKSLRAPALALVDTMNTILRNYEDQGFDLTLRQLYYQLVSRNVIPNTEQSYKRVGTIVSDARLSGLMDWNMIVDRGRYTSRNSHWDTPADILESSAYSFAVDKWENQPWHIECMVEKQALEGVLQPTCSSLDIPFTANKGYSSASQMRLVGKRIQRKMKRGKNVCLIYLGDHDPSGIDMTRDVEERCKLFSGYTFNKIDEKTGDYRLYQDSAYSGLEFVVRRVALNMDQVDEYSPPPNPAKLEDPRAQGYISKYGDESWELDALEPSLLASLVTALVDEYRDADTWAEDMQRQEDGKQHLRDYAQMERDRT